MASELQALRTAELQIAFEAALEDAKTLPDQRAAVAEVLAERRAKERRSKRSH
jgi:hypothetical protein